MKVINKFGTSLAILLFLIIGSAGVQLYYFCKDLGLSLATWSFLLTCVATLFLVGKTLKSGVLKFPPYWKLYFLYMCMFIITLFWSAELSVSIEFFFLFLSGGMVWLLAYNFSNSFRYLEVCLVIFGLISATLALYNFLYNKDYISPFSLIYQAHLWRNHHHIGDIWAVILLIIIKNKKVWFKSKIQYIPFIVFGLVILFFSQSRSAYVSFLVGYLFLNKRFFSDKKKLSKTFPVILFVSLMIFVIGIQKTILFSRPFYVQALAGLLNHPLGVGVGAFSHISEDPANHLFGMSNYSQNVHNLPLEIMSGMGVFGIIFIYWLYKVVKDAVCVYKKRAIIYSVIFVTLTVNFIFDYTYFIPGMLWTWFASLGLFQAAINAGKR